MLRRSTSIAGMADTDSGISMRLSSRFRAVTMTSSSAEACAFAEGMASSPRASEAIITAELNRFIGLLGRGNINGLLCLQDVT